MSPFNYARTEEKGQLMAENSEQLKMCELRAKGFMEEIDRRSTDPTVVCGKCGLKANLPEHLHNPRPLVTKKHDNFWSS
jgi:hypothetical protein